jgi:adenylate kinase family enzyme
MALPPHTLIHKIVEEYFDHIETPGVTLVDGYPREACLTPIIEQAVDCSKLIVKGCVYIAVNDNVSVNRQITRTSMDSHPSYGYVKAGQRVVEHNLEVHPVIKELGRLYGLDVVDGEQNKERVLSDFIAVLGKLMLA